MGRLLPADQHDNLPGAGRAGRLAVPAAGAGHWVTATRNDLATGGAIAAAALIGLISAAAALMVRDLCRSRTHHGHRRDRTG
jgi:hypothetical protein